MQPPFWRCPSCLMRNTLTKDYGQGFRCQHCQNVCSEVQVTELLDEHAIETADRFPTYAQPDHKQLYYHVELQRVVGDVFNEDLIGCILPYTEDCYQPGDSVVARDRHGMWCKGEIITLDVDYETALVLFHGMLGSWVEWTPLDYQTLMPRYTLQAARLDDAADSQ